jgi:site-specific DNA recombinase
MTSSLRVLGRIRLSKDADETGTSIERQRESIEQWSKMHGHTVIGWAVDSGVSGSVDPFDTPELGPWLERHHDWDALVAYRLDRLSRRVIPLNKLFGFIQQHDKTLASVSESLDLSTWIGRLVANVIAGVAEGELEAIRERNIGSQKTVRELGRWHGGTPPYGYQAEKRQSGYYLVPLAAERDVIRNEILPRVLAYESAKSIAEKLNAKGIPTRKDAEWTGMVIRQMLRRGALLGQAEHKGKLLVDDDGMPALRAEPILTTDEHRKVIEALDRRAFRNGSHQPNPLSGVLFCIFCEAPMHAAFRRTNDPSYYRCAERGQSCTRSRSIRPEMAYELVEEHFLSSVGGVQRQAKVFVPGRYSRQSVGDIEAAIAVCRRERDLGLYDGDDDAYFKRLKALIGKRDELQQIPTSPGFEWQPLGETYGQAWKTLDVEQRRTMLLDSKIRVYIGRGLGNEYFGKVYIPEEIEENISR